MAVSRLMKTECDYKRLFLLCENHIDCNILKKDVIARIREEMAKKEFKYMIFFRSAVTLSLFGLILSIRSLYISIKQSGFYDFVSLTISDQSIIISLWKELTFSIIQSIPFLGITFLLTSFVAFIIFGIKSIHSKEILLTLKI